MFAWKGGSTLNVGLASLLLTVGATTDDIGGLWVKKDYTALIIGCRGLGNRLSVLTRHPAHVEEPDAWALLRFAGPDYR
jgi:hypothetical protein